MNIFKYNPIEFLKEVKKELTLSFYPTGQEIRHWFIYISITVAIFSIVFFLMDGSLSSIMKEFLNKGVK